MPGEIFTADRIAAEMARDWRTASGSIGKRIILRNVSQLVRYACNEYCGFGDVVSGTHGNEGDDGIITGGDLPPSSAKLDGDGASRDGRQDRGNRRQTGTRHGPWPNYRDRQVEIKSGALRVLAMSS